MNTFTDKSDRYLLWFIVLFGVICSIYYMINQKIVVDSTQILQRGYLFKEGFLLPFGPRSTNSNFVYGSIVSIFVGIFLKIYDHPISPLIGICLLHLMGFWFLLKVKFLKLNQTFFIIYLFLFWASPWRTSEVFLWNPSFLFPVMSLYLYGLQRSINKKDFWGSFIIGLTWVLAFQIHNSFIFLIILSLVLFIKKKIQFDWFSLSLSLLIGLISLLPTMYVIYNHPEILQLNTNQNSYLFKNLLMGGEAIKGILYWIRYPSLYFGSTTFQLAETSWQEADLGAKVWVCIKWGLAIMSLLIVVWSNYLFFRTEKGFLKDLCHAGFISLVIVSCLSPVSFNFWHLYLIYPLSLIPLAWFLSEKINVRLLMLPLGIYFAAYTLISANSSYKHHSDSKQLNSYQENVLSLHKEILEKYQNLLIYF